MRLEKKKVKKKVKNIYNRQQKQIFESINNKRRGEKNDPNKIKSKLIEKIRTRRDSKEIRKT